MERERDELGAELGAEEVAARAAELAARQREALGEWGVGAAELAEYVAGTSVRVLTPGGSAGESAELAALPLVVFDEVYGFLPPRPANPPTKRPLVALMKQARGFGVGVLVATQNPMDLDYRALSNAGLWCLGRLQTDADRERVLDGLAGSGRGSEGAGSGAGGDELGRTLQRLAPRWFVVRNTHVTAPLVLLRPRHALSLLRGPLTRVELRAARQAS